MSYSHPRVETWRDSSSVSALGLWARSIVNDARLGPGASHVGLSLLGFVRLGRGKRITFPPAPSTLARLCGTDEGFVRDVLSGLQALGYLAPGGLDEGRAVFLLAFPEHIELAA